jgi:hypothetical protein
LSLRVKPPINKIDHQDSLIALAINRQLRLSTT